ncbi:MAG: FMN-binding protein [bacterium]|nr:FMN-binding protein [bacterium]
MKRLNLLTHITLERVFKRACTSRLQHIAVLYFFLFAFPVFAQLPSESPDGPDAVKIYLTEAQALEKAFPKADTLWSEVWTPTPQARNRIQRRLGWRLEEKSFTIHQGRKNGNHLGYAVITEQIGLYKPITFIVKTNPEARAEAVWIMVYRESRGGQIRRQRFLRQYQNKTARNPIRLNRDIIGITGATLSVRALNAGVKRILTVLEAGYLQKDTE